MRTRKKWGIALCLVAISFQRLYAMDLISECRFRPQDDGLSLICHVQNNAGSDFTFRDPSRGFSVFQLIELHDSSRRTSRLSNRPTGPADPMIAIPPSKSHQWELGIKDLSPRYEFISGTYMLMSWMAGAKSAEYVCLGFADKDGNIRLPKVDPKNPNAELYVGFIYHEEKAPEVSFLFLNGTDEDVIIEKPLNLSSRIAISVPSIDYKRDFHVLGRELEQATIESGKAAEWRLPWQTVFDLISQDDLNKIKAAKGDFDMVWKIGEYESNPLPISLERKGTSGAGRSYSMTPPWLIPGDRKRMPE